MTKFTAFALAFGLSASTNAGLVVPALLLLGVIAAVASDSDDT